MTVGIFDRPGARRRVDSDLGVADLGAGPSVVAGHATDERFEDRGTNERTGGFEAPGDVGAMEEDAGAAEGGAGNVLEISNAFTLAGDDQFERLADQRIRVLPRRFRDVRVGSNLRQAGGPGPEPGASSLGPRVEDRHEIIAALNS